MSSPTHSLFSTWKSSKSHAIHREVTAQSQLTLPGEQLESQPTSLHSRARCHLLAELDSSGTRAALAVCCFLSGCESVLQLCAQ